MQGVQESFSKLGNGRPRIQFAKAQDLNGLDGVTFLEFERNGTIARE